jgi:hypothetical protein
MNIQLVAHRLLQYITCNIYYMKYNTIYILCILFIDKKEPRLKGEKGLKQVVSPLQKKQTLTGYKRFDTTCLLVSFSLNPNSILSSS